jgi:hypothetical protein
MLAIPEGIAHTRHEFLRDESFCLRGTARSGLQSEEKRICTKDDELQVLKVFK